LDFFIVPLMFPRKPMEKGRSRWATLREKIQSFWDARDVSSGQAISRLHKFGHFWVLVWKSFSRNRCPVRAAGLAYASLLALIPMLVVAMSVTGSLLTKKGEERIGDFIFTFVASITPPGTLTGTNLLPEADNGDAASESASTESTNNGTLLSTNTPVPGVTNRASTSSAVSKPPVPRNSSSGAASGTNGNSASPARPEVAIKAREQISDQIHRFVQNTRTGTLGVTGGIVLVFAAIGMLIRIEETMNDIWGARRGRSWPMRIILYWGVLTLVPVLLVGALGLASGPHFQTSKAFITRAPFIGSLIFRMLPVVVLCLTFATFYMLMPNTKVQWKAALIGGFTGGLLFHINNLVSVLYVSRVISYSRIYGSLGLVPVFIVGLYLSWLILLFGAQMAYAYQNRTSYLEEKQVEHINQRGREFIALRLITCVGQRFIQGVPPPSVTAISEELNVPTRLIEQTMHTLCGAYLIAETAGAEPAYLPARPLEQITCHDVLMAMRASHGRELATREEPARNEVYGEFSRIEAAEREAAASVTILALATRAAAKQLTG
jgi:membrane protein